MKFALTEAADLGDLCHPRTPAEPIALHLTRMPGSPGLPRKEQHRIGRAELLATPFRTFERNIRDQLGRILSPGGFDPARDILGIAVNRWAHSERSAGAARVPLRVRGSKEHLMRTKRQQIRMAGLAGIALLLGASPAPVAWSQDAAASETPPPVLESETASNAKLRPLKAHDLLLSRFEGGVRIIDGDTTKTVGTVYSSVYANFALAPDNKFLYIAETYWARGNRGPRQDLLSVYSGDELKLVAEIPLPGRLISDPKTHNFHISADGRYGYVYNFQPASSVVVVDLQMRKVTGIVEIPGCGQVLPWGARGFAALCADGSMAVANADAKGKYSVTRTAKFFDVDNDPIFDESVIDRQAAQAFFISYTGLVYPVTLGEHPTIGEPWSMQRAAGLSPATTKVGHITWRPSGNVLSAYHRATGRLFVLMHEGPHWDYAQPGSEIWVLDTKEKKLITRLEVPQAAGIIAVTQDAEPVLFAIGEEHMWVLNAESGELLRAADVSSPSLVAVKDF